MWTKQLRDTLQWFVAFFAGNTNQIERFFRLDAYLRIGQAIEIGTDASPWGMGGWLTIDGQFKHFFACPISSEDTAMFVIPSGMADDQQLWECLTVLIAIDIWSKLWNQIRIILNVRGDNVGALTLLRKLRPVSPTIAIVARELALGLVE